MNELALFAGAGGGILGGHLLGWNTVCAVELERYPREVLLQRQRDGILPVFPIWDDVCTFDGRPWRGLVDVVSGGFPCQDISAAGKGAGIDGARSGLWAEMHRIICEVRPRFAFMENSPMLTSRGLGRVLGDLAASGYDAAWLVLGADDVGAPHQRKRIWILAENVSDSRSIGRHEGAIRDQGERKGAFMALDRRGEAARTRALFNAACLGREAKPVEAGDACQTLAEEAGEQFSGASGRQVSPWRAEPDVGRVADGVAARVDRLKAIGNGQVPLVAATAFCLLKDKLENVKRNDQHGTRNFIY